MEDIIIKIKNGLVPVARANAVAKTFEELFSISSISEGSLKRALNILSVPRGTEEDAGILGRRKTCREIADLLEEESDSTNVVEVWNAWLNAFATSNDPRHAAMAKTFEREQAELQG